MDALHVRVRERPGVVSPAHETVQVFIGPDRDHLALSGELVMSHVEWDTLRGRLRVEQARGRAYDVVFSIGGPSEEWGPEDDARAERRREESGAS